MTTEQTSVEIAALRQRISDGEHKIRPGNYAYVSDYRLTANQLRRDRKRLAELTEPKPTANDRLMSAVFASFDQQLADMVAQ